ncbi:MAG: sigma-70 family RNA polymerase sigma factor [Chloroflexi bacterium]|nr:sigma-70 family RNA polymerase sigma factor [Chloroflexota bacterium]
MVDATDPRVTRDDETVVAALRVGDERAFIDLVQRYQCPLLRLAQTFVPSQAVAEEVVQDTWIAVIKGIDRFEGRSSLRTWVFKILTFQAKSRGERERRSIPMSAFQTAAGGADEPAIDPTRFRPSDDFRWPGHWADPPADWGSDAEARLLGRETQEVIASAMETLAPAQRLVMTLRDLEGWDSDDVCAALEISPGNQRVLLHRARSRVRASLERYFMEAARV